MLLTGNHISDLGRIVSLFDIQETNLFNGYYFESSVKKLDLQQTTLMACIECTNCTVSACNSGLYGSNCNLSCNPSCREQICSTCRCEICNQVTGNCTNGCETEWYGAKCEYRCPEKCMLTEGNNGICDRETGICLNGCQTGFYGEQCNNTCFAGCIDLSCKAPNGTCTKGCIDGYEKDFCGNSSNNGLDKDEVAGAIGGAFVITLWAIVVIILSFVIWKRRLKDSEVFNLNSSFGNEQYRSSSRRCISRHSVNSSSLNGDADHVEEMHIEQEFESQTVNTHTPLNKKRSVNFGTDSPEQRSCPEMELQGKYVCSESTEARNKYGDELRDYVPKFHAHYYANGEDAAHLQFLRTSSEGDLYDVAQFTCSETDMYMSE